VSQPEQVVPITSKRPISASSDAPVTSVRWWSTAAGIRWVPISPLVERPQMKKVLVRNQNVGELKPSSSPSMAGRNGCVDRSGTGTGSVAP
jgi:hypothetical protein